MRGKRSGNSSAGVPPKIPHFKIPESFFCFSSAVCFDEKIIGGWDGLFLCYSRKRESHHHTRRIVLGREILCWPPHVCLVGFDDRADSRTLAIFIFKALPPPLPPAWSVLSVGLRLVRFASCLAACPQGVESHASVRPGTKSSVLRDMHGRLFQGWNVGKGRVKRPRHLPFLANPVADVTASLR